VRDSRMWYSRFMDIFLRRVQESEEIMENEE